MTRNPLSAAPARPGRKWGRWLLGLTLLGLALAFAAAWATVLSEGPDAMIHVVVNGDTLDVRSDGPLPPAHAVVLAGSVALIALLAVGVALMAVPLALVAVGLALGLVVVAGLGLPLLVLGGLGLLLMAPVLLLGRWLWRRLRGPRSIAA